MTLSTYSTLARILTADDPLAVQIERCLHVVRTDLPDLDVQITVWGHGQQRVWSTSDDVLWDATRTAQVARRRQPLIFDQQATLLPTSLSLPAPRLEPPSERSYMGLPVLWEGRLWAVLEAQRVGPFTSGERTLLLNLSPLLATAVGEEQWGRLARPSGTNDLELPAQRAIDQLAQTLESPLELASLLDVVLREAMHATKASSGAINLMDYEHEEYSLAHSIGFPAQPGASGERNAWPLAVGVVGRVARTGKATLLTDTSHGPEWASPQADVRAELVIPIHGPQQVLAVLVLATTREPVFTTEDLYAAQSIADLATKPLQRALEYQALIEVRTQLQQTLESLPLGLALLDGEGRLLRTNPAWFQHWHIDPRRSGDLQYVPWDMLPLLLSRLSHPLELSDFFAECQSHPQKTFETTMRLQEPDQDIRLRSSPVLDAHSTPNGRLVMIEDITREREIDKMKNEFVSVVSHELRTPLTSILGYTELLLARDFPPVERQEFIQTVYDQANQLSKMVDDLLSLSRLDAGQIKLSRWVVSLHQIIAEITRQLNETLSARHRLLIDIPANIPPIYADKDKIRQILTNLLSNAIKYSPDGGQVALFVRELRTPPPDAPNLPKERAVLIAVRDQGLGIAPADLPNVFNRFFRVDNSNTRKIGGTGLGLSITKALVELHGGRIWVTSTVGKGSTFWLTLPIATELARRS